MPTASVPSPAAATPERRPSAPSRSADPSGNNGTVKVDRLGDIDRIPNDVAHPGCTFQVEWYGFDGGPDVVSTVTFTAQAPTAGAGITVSGPTTVPVGGDAASGAGTDTGLDAVQAYTLSLTGAAQPRQGYHVRLTVSTPRSRGNDTKTKMFWVEPCTTARPTASFASATAPALATGISTGASPTAPQAPDMSTQFWAGVPQHALGLVTGQLARPAPGSSGSSDVPTAVDAGARVERAARSADSLATLALTLGGLGAVGAAAALRLRRRA